MERKESGRRLYLAKGGPIDIHIDATLPPHQIEGVRFLHRLFTKGKPGAIVNDPSGLGKRVQTVLFINAMRPLLEKPVLILCKDPIQDHKWTWINVFEKWSNMAREVKASLMNPPIHKSFVYINPMCNVNTFSRHEWSILVVDDPTINRDVLRASLNAQFKIWITPVDMKKTVQTFSMIYKWMYPKDKFNIHDYQATSKLPSVVHMRTVLLDAFMEDVVIRRKGGNVHFERKDEQEPLRRPPKETRKNKDATGKKIKRSKRSQVPEANTKDIIDNFIHDLENYKQINMAVDDIEDDKKINDKYNKDTKKNENKVTDPMDEDNKDRENDEIPSKKTRIKRNSDTSDESDIDKPTKVSKQLDFSNLNVIKTTDVDKVDKNTEFDANTNHMQEIRFDAPDPKPFHKFNCFNNLNDQRINNDTPKRDDNNEIIEADNDDKKKESQDLFSSNEIDTKNDNKSKCDRDTIEFKENNEIIKAKEDRDIKEKGESVDLFNTNEVNNKNDYNRKCDIDTPEIETNLENKVDKEREDDTPELDENNKIIETAYDNHDKSKLESADLFSNDEIETKELSNEMKINANEIKNNTENGTANKMSSDDKTKSSNDGKNDSISENKTENEVEARRKRIEEITMKKFKGSLFDSIF